MRELDLIVDSRAFQGGTDYREGPARLVSVAVTKEQNVPSTLVRAFAEVHDGLRAFVADQNLPAIAQPSPPTAKKRLNVRKTKIAVHGRIKGSRSEIRPSDDTA